MIISSEATQIYLGACAPCRRPARATVERAGRYTSIKCLSCGEPVRAERLHTTVSRTGCHDQCLFAIGPNCSCLCEGHNHGGGWMYEDGEMLESALEEYRARLDAEEAARTKRAEARARKAKAEFNEWVADAGAEDALAYLRSADRPMIPFLDDLEARVGEYKPLSPGQLGAVEKFLANDRARAEREDAGEAQPVPTGKSIEVEGEIVHTKTVTKTFGHRETAVHKMLIQGEGWKVWSTIPREMCPTSYTAETWYQFMKGLKGQMIRFTATVEASRDDVSFGIAKRPRKVTLTA